MHKPDSMRFHFEIHGFATRPRVISTVRQTHCEHHAHYLVTICFHVSVQVAIALADCQKDSMNKALFKHAHVNLHVSFLPSLRVRCTATSRVVSLCGVPTRESESRTFTSESSSNFPEHRVNSCPCPGFRADDLVADSSSRLRTAKGVDVRQITITHTHMPPRNMHPAI